MPVITRPAALLTVIVSGKPLSRRLLLIVTRPAPVLMVMPVLTPVPVIERVLGPEIVTAAGSLTVKLEIASSTSRMVF